MIKQLFKVKTLSAVLLSAFMVIAVSSFVELNAQQQAMIAMSEQEELDPNEYQDFKRDYSQIIEEIQNNPGYTETEREIRLYFYEQIRKNVAKGNSISTSIDSARLPTTEYADKHINGAAVDIRSLVEEAQQRLL